MANTDIALIKKNNIKRLKDLSPEVLLIFPDSITKAWLSIWEPYLLSMPYKYAVIANNHDNKDISTIKSPLFFSKEGITISQLLKIKSLKVFLYPTNRPNNFGYLNKFPHIQHIFIGHGDSDKLSSSSRFSTVYDFLFVADNKAHLRYAYRGVNIPFERFITIGAPVTPGLSVCINRNNNIKNILYAPTSEGKASDSNFSSLFVFDAIHELSLLSKSFEIDFRPHPGMGERLEAYKKLKAQLVEKFSKKLSKEKAYNQADIIICDISGVMSEFLFTNKPIIVPYDKDSKLVMNAIENSEFKEYVYLWDVQRQSLSDLIKSIEKEDPLFDTRLKYRNEKFFSSTSFEESVNFFNKAIQFTLLKSQIMK
ncbi:CDP-glycerol glycerophosphotransferase family protein [Acinetobacter thermotolerans]|uniref:CDP-glycerol glycerophosphotransferase family protein n=1 Tax=Acinetobacter thermotolerans TaxID=3151487 RepID=UPI00325AE495